MKFRVLVVFCLLLLFLVHRVQAQETQLTPADELSVTITGSVSPSPEVTVTPEPTGLIQEPSIFERPEERQILESEERPLEEIQSERAILFNGRIIDQAGSFTFLAYTVQRAVQEGVPAETVTLVLLLPLLATMVTFIRLVVGLPTLGLLVPIAFSITLLATGITTGIVLLISIILASTLARFMLKRIRIMQLPKVALSMFFVSLFIFLTLMFSAMSGALAIKQLSIFPVLMLILLSERIFDLQLQRTNPETIQITTVTILLAIGGYFLLSSEILRTVILVYPELILLLIPANIFIGRYFGLRLTEYYRFSPLRNAGS